MIQPRELLDAILDPRPEAHVGRLSDFVASASFEELQQGALVLHEFANRADGNVYQRVRALFQAHAIYRYFLPRRRELPQVGAIPRRGQELLLLRHYAAAADAFLASAKAQGITDPVVSRKASLDAGRVSRASPRHLGTVHAEGTAAPTQPVAK